jgi:tRNA threonylcarbamoyl adenosine modification protein YeaZ
VTARTLVISTASPALSLALFADDRLVAHDHRIIGRGHAEALLPAVAALMAGQAPPDAVLVDIGPGSFTGIRIGMAAARALGLAWGVPVHGLSGAALVAAQALAMRPELARLGVLLDAGRGQLLFADFGADLSGGSVATLAAAAVPAGLALAGAGTLLLPDGHGRDVVHDGQPDVAWALALPAVLRGLPAAAHYVRPPDAILPL